MTPNTYEKKDVATKMWKKALAYFTPWKDGKRLDLGECWLGFARD
jgi:hypothetical protein